MAVTLYLDVGNSACKWRLVGQGRQQDRFVHHADWQALAERLPLAQADRIVVASVLGGAGSDDLAQVLRAASGKMPEFRYARHSELGVVNAYAEPRRLGVDRWLGLVEAHITHGAVIVIDCGSATTIDAVDATGQHLGGYIVPGLTLMHASLGRATPNVALQSGRQEGSHPGKNTDEAVGHGIHSMLVAFIADRMVALGRQLADTSTTVMTGGDAKQLLPLLEPKIQYCPDLVLDGLERLTRDGDRS